MDKEAEEIMEEVVQSQATVTDTEREYRRLSPEERAQLPRLLRAWFDALYGSRLTRSPYRAPAVKPGAFSLLRTVGQDRLLI